jgi:DNA (cytosine-5)-methyltransferase 1
MASQKTPPELLSEVYNKAMSVVGLSGKNSTNLEQKSQDLLNIVLKYSEQAKAVLTVLITSIVYKAIHPNQDIRNHQASIEGGYSGRTFDSKYITPFMKLHKFPSMAESGWLTKQNVSIKWNYCQLKVILRQIKVVEELAT